MLPYAMRIGAELLPACAVRDLMCTLMMLCAAYMCHTFVQIIKVLGTPTREEIRAMNSNYTEVCMHPHRSVCAVGTRFDARLTKALSSPASLVPYWVATTSCRDACELGDTLFDTMLSRLHRCMSNAKSHALFAAYHVQRSCSHLALQS